MRRGLAALGVGAALLGGSAAPSRGEATASAAPGAPPPSPPQGLVVRSFQELQQLVADPAGPKDLVIEGQLEGDLVIKRPVALRGAPGALLRGTGRDTVVTIDAHDVVIEDLAIRRSGHRHTHEDSGLKASGERVRISRVDIAETLFGISLQACRHCVLERVNVTGYDSDEELRGDGIKLWEAHDSIVRDCRMIHSRDLVVWYTSRATLERNTVERSRYGSHFMYAKDSVVRDSRFRGNVVGVFVMYSMRLKVERNVLAGARGAAGIGLGFKDSDAIELKGNWMVANTTGTYLDNTPRTPADAVKFEGNVLALNDVGMRLHASERGLHLYGNAFRDNAVVIEVDGGGNALGVDLKGNYFSDYEGYDLDGDGTGDVAYEVKALSSQLTEAHPTLKFFYGTAAMSVMDAIAYAVPVLSAKRLLVDPSPKMYPPQLATP